jgi:rhamnosyl/mannosyltransferase
MRVLHVGKYYPPVPGGVERFLADLVGALQRRSIATAALVHRERAPLAAGNQVEDPDTRDQTPLIRRVPTFGQLLYAPISPGFPWWLDRAIRDFKPDLLHLHVPNTSAFAALVVPRARRVPWVVHWHADVAGVRVDRRLALAYGFYRPFEQALLRHARAVIATSPPYLEASPALRPWRERCTVNPLGLDTGRLVAPDAAALAWAEQRWGEQGLRVLAVGRLTHYKGHDVLIDAARQLPEVRVMIAGGGERHALLAARINQHGLQARVTLANFVPDEQLYALMASCDLLCLPSLERTEAFGMVLLEAMHFGKPVVVSDIPGSGRGWVVSQAGNGLLTRPGDALSLAEALARLQASPAERARLGEQGRAALARLFAIDRTAEDIAALYTQVLQADAGRGGQL